MEEQFPHGSMLQRRALLACCLLFASFAYAHAQGTATRKVLFEEFTGEWCSLCPGGSIEMDRALRAFAGSVVPISYHDNDPLEMPALNAMLDSIPFDPLYPGGTFDRYPYGIDNPKHKMSVDRFDFMSTLNKAAARAAHASISAAVTIDTSARTLRAETLVEFLAADTGDFRIQCVVTEHAVERNGMQRNGYNTDSVTYPQLFGAGDPLRMWAHDDVARALLGGATGRSGVIPPHAVPGQAYTTTFSYSVPVTIDIDRIGVAVFVSEYQHGSLTGNEVLNADGYLGSVITGVAPASRPAPETLELFPNPCDGIAYLQNASTPRRAVEVDLLDVMGRRIAAARVHPFPGAFQLDLRALPAGLYLVCYRYGDAIQVKPLLRR